MSFRLSFRTCVLLGLLWLGSLAVVSTVAAAQARAFQPLPEPVILTGADIGFRVEGMMGDTPAGQIVIRTRDGEWVVPQSSLGAHLVR